MRIKIGIGDVAAILTQMRGDAICTGFGSHQRGAQGVGMQATARIADGGDVIDVDAEAQVVAHAARLPGLIAGIAASSGGSASGL